MRVMKRLAAQLPTSLQRELKRFRYRRQILNHRFVTAEPEYKILDTIVKPHAWVIDVRANVGHYTKRCSDLVGPEGRVIAFEPVSETFALLAGNVQLFKFANVTLINAAASNKLSLVGMKIPTFSTGLKNFYQAQIETLSSDPLSIKVVTLTLDLYQFPNPISLIKIDAECHELFVLRGMLELIRRDHPVLIIETESMEVIDLLNKYDYMHKRLPGSPNWLFLHRYSANFSI